MYVKLHRLVKVMNANGLDSSKEYVSAYRETLLANNY